MRTRLRTAALIATAGALVVVTATPAAAAEIPAPAQETRWTYDLRSGDGVGVDTSDGTARLDTAHAFTAPADHAATEGARSVPTGLLTLAAQHLTAPADRILATLLADLPDGTSAAVDVRGMRPDGGWTEWIPADGAEPVAVLPEPATDVQTRLVLTGSAAASPVVRSVALGALPAARVEGTRSTEVAPLNFRVFATREGLVGGTTANGHVIVERDLFVALPSRRALSPRDTSDYSVKVCVAGGRCAFAPVWDVGPWNTRDDYWNPAAKRQEWSDLPQGVPQSQAAFKDGYNDGRDQYDRKVLNPAGIDLGDGMFRDALGLTDNSWVTVDYLWTGSVRLSKVVATENVPVRAAPDPAAAVVGLAAQHSSVPVECAAVTDGSWLRIGTGMFVEAAAVQRAAPAKACAAGAGPAAP